MPSLQCPDCGQAHALDSVGGAASFRCRGCGRALKVPERLRTAPPSGPPQLARGPATRADVPRAEAPDSAPAGAATEQVETDRAGSARQSGRREPVSVAVGYSGPLLLRVVIWIFAIPLGALVVFGLAETVGVLSSRQLLATFLETGVARFGAVARLLPFWALTSAAIVHFTVMAIGRYRHRRSRTGSEPDGGVESVPGYEREPARAGS